MAFASPVPINIWSDYVCPFCYLELPAVMRLHATVADLVA